MSRIRTDAPRGYPAWVVFGAVWGVWGAALPQVRAQAHVDDGQLGTALLFIGLGALPAMVFTGRAMDRWWRAIPAAAVVAVTLAGVLVAVAGRGPVSLGIVLAILGAASGAADVAVNALAGAAERVTSEPVIARSHGTFSASVVGGSIVTGGLRLAGAPLVVPFLLVAAGGLVAAGHLLWRGPMPPPRDPGGCEPTAQRPRWLLALVPAGLVAALALAVENAQQSWSAVFLGDELHVHPGWTAAAPAVFAGVVAVTRFGAGPLTRRAPVALMVSGGAVAAAGTLLLATAPDLAAAMIGLALAAAGTATLYPTMLSASLARVAPSDRGRATSTLAATAYLGFLFGPIYVGALASAGDLRVAFVGVAVLAVGFAAAAGPVSAAARRATGA